MLVTSDMEVANGFSCEPASVVITVKLPMIFASVNAAVRNALAEYAFIAVRCTLPSACVIVNRIQNFVLQLASCSQCTIYGPNRSIVTIFSAVLYAQVRNLSFVEISGSVIA